MVDLRCHKYNLFQFQNIDYYMTKRIIYSLFFQRCVKSIFLRKKKYFQITLRDLFKRYIGNLLENCTGVKIHAH